MSDATDLDAALAAEEHTQGRPYTADPDHCDRCAEVDRAWMQATCEHDCNDCGHVWTGDLVPTVPPPPPISVDVDLGEWWPK